MWHITTVLVNSEERYEEREFLIGLQSCILREGDYDGDGDGDDIGGGKFNRCLLSLSKSIFNDDNFI